MADKRGRAKPRAARAAGMSAAGAAGTESDPIVDDPGDPALQARDLYANAKYKRSRDTDGPTLEVGVNLSGEFADAMRDPRQIRFGPPTVIDADAEQLWQAIRFHTDQIGFPAFADFLDRVFCETPMPFPAGTPGERFATAARESIERFRTCAPPAGAAGASPFPGFIPGGDAYATLKLAAEVFLLLRCGVCPPIQETSTNGTSMPWWDDQDILGTSGGAPVDPAALAQALATFLGSDRSSYIRGIVENVFPDHAAARAPGTQFPLSPFCPLAIGFGPCLLELIWSYWHEQAMQVQTMNAIALRFQNVRLGRGRDPLAELEIDPLRPLSGFLWGYIQDEHARLSVARRAYEYNHHYGLNLYGRAVRGLRPADPRSRFLQSFHDLLRATDQFYRESADNTVTPDAFPLLIALRDLHLTMAEAAHNQFRDLPWTARVEMLIQQWLLARPEMRDFLRGRLMVPYAEGWMGAVDAMKRLQGWTDTNVTHFHDLGVFGERLLLTVRHVSWNTITDPLVAADWAVFWRPEIQGYIHAYRAVTGVSLSDDVVEVSRTGDARYLQPSFHMRNRLLEQQSGRAISSGTAADAMRAPGTAPRALPRPR